MVAIVFSIGCSFAYFTARATSKGNLEFANLTIQAVTADDQVYTSQVFNNRINTKFKPGDNYTIKDIYVKNSGDCEVYALLELCLSFIKESDTSVSYTKTYWYNLAGTELTGDIAQTTVEATLVGVGEKVVSTFNLIIPEELDNTYKNATAKISIKIHAIQALLQAENGLSIAVTASRMIYNNKTTPVNTAFYKRIDANGNLDANGDYILFGSYPQTIKSADVTIDESDVDSNGYYLGSDGERYAKRNVGSFGWYSGTDGTDVINATTFSDGSSIQVSAEYYFKVEPIKWRILKTENGKAMLLSEDIISAYTWDDKSGYVNYDNSLIRTWLNNTFINLMFDETQQLIIQTTEVDNSINSGNNIDTVCDNTFDKVFLLSGSESVNSVYGFNQSMYDKDSMRRKNVSDYVRAIGGYVGYWWTRTAEAHQTTYNKNAILNWSPVGRYNGAITTNYFGVVPAVTILL